MFIYKLCSTETSRKSRVAVSDTCTTPVQQKSDKCLQKNIYLFAWTLYESVSNARITLLSHGANNSDKCFKKKLFFLCFNIPLYIFGQMSHISTSKEG